MSDNAGWKRLGDRVKSERLVHWRTRASFAQACGLGEKTVYDLEKARRANFAEETLAAIEATLGWNPGDADRVRRGLEPSRTTDPALAHLIAIWPELTPAARRHILDIAERSRRP